MICARDEAEAELLGAAVQDLTLRHRHAQDIEIVEGREKRQRTNGAVSTPKKSIWGFNPIKRDDGFGDPREDLAGPPVAETRIKHRGVYLTAARSAPRITRVLALDDRASAAEIRTIPSLPMKMMIIDGDGPRDGARPGRTHSAASDRPPRRSCRHDGQGDVRDHWQRAANCSPAPDRVDACREITPQESGVPCAAGAGSYRRASRAEARTCHCGPCGGWQRNSGSRWGLPGGSSWGFGRLSGDGFGRLVRGFVDWTGLGAPAVARCCQWVVFAAEKCVQPEPFRTVG